jgi:hypothetical protein
MQRVGWYRRLGAAVVGVSLAAAGVTGTLTVVGARAASADTAPAAQAGTPSTVSADALPTMQVNGIVWAQVTVGNTVYTITSADAVHGNVVNTATATGSGVAGAGATATVASTPGRATVDVEKPTPLAYTGNDSQLQLIVAGMLIGVGCLLMMARRRRPARHGR